MDEQQLRDFEQRHGLTRDQMKELISDTKWVYGLDHMGAKRMVFASLDATGKPPAGVELNRSKQ